MTLTKTYTCLNMSTIEYSRVYWSECPTVVQMSSFVTVIKWCLTEMLWKDRNALLIMLQCKHERACERVKATLYTVLYAEERCGSAKLLMTVAAAALPSGSLRVQTQQDSHWSHIKRRPDTHTLICSGGFFSVTSAWPAFKTCCIH